MYSNIPNSLSAAYITHLPVPWAPFDQFDIVLSHPHKTITQRKYQNIAISNAQSL